MEAFTLPPPAIIPVSLAGRETVQFDLYETAEFLREIRGQDAPEIEWMPKLKEYLAKQLGVAQESLATNQVEAFNNLICRAHKAVFEYTKKNDGLIACLQQLIPESPAISEDGET